MESFISQAGYAAVFLFGFLEACCVPIPSEVTFGTAGVLASEGHLNIVGVIIIGTIAELAGSLVSYGIGRAGGRPLVHRYGRYLLVTRADIDRAERFFAGRGAWAVSFGRALPVVRTFVSIVAGFIEVPALLFGVLSLLGTAVWVTTISLVGYGVGSAWTSISKGIAVAGYVIAAVAVVGIALFIYHRLKLVRAEAAAASAGGAGQPGAAPAEHQERQPSPRSPMS
jgi:membrane protein DedA with SNARE-associated domain